MKLEGLRRSIRMARVMLGAIWRITRSRALRLAILTLAEALGTPTAAYLSKRVVDALGVTPRTALLLAVVYLALVAVQTWGRHVFMILLMDVGDRVSQHFEHELLAITLRAPGMEHMERQDFADKVQGVSSQVYLPMNLTMYISNVFHLLVGVGSSLFLLATVDISLLFVLVLILPGILFQYRNERRFSQHWFDTAPEQRLEQAYIGLATNPDAAKEVRVFGLGPLILQRYREVTAKYHRVLFHDRLKRSGLAGASGLLQGAALAAGMVWMVQLAGRGQATPGDLVMSVPLLQSAIQYLSFGLGMYSGLAQIASMSEGYLWLLDYASPVQSPDPREAVAPPNYIRHGIHLESVNFTYPATETPVLVDVTLDIPSGTTLAIVGNNGAGKTSLVKLLCRFYDPTSGTVTVDGTDLRRFELDTWRKQSTAVFQDFQNFTLCARESIGLGHLPHIADREAVIAASVRAGADVVIKDLPEGLETQLGAQFPGGIELSTGQWQRIALARGSMRTAPAVVILDEPTASLDAKAESEVFRRFLQMARPSDGLKPITILVSHRFSTVRMADQIVVLDEGRIIEHGSHQELIAHGGLYAELYELQGRAYG